MGTFDALARGFVLALTPAHLMWAFVGATLGTAVGVPPGIGPALTVALLLPVTFNVEPTSAFIMFAGIYYGAMYGGSTTSILLNTPGETASIVSAIEGNVMARQGRGRAHDGGDRLVRRRHAGDARPDVLRAAAREGRPAAGVLVPLLTLGLPTSSTAAVMLAAFQQYGLQPGPLLFTAQPDLVWALVASLYVGNVMLLVLNLPLVGVWVHELVDGLA